MAQFRHFKDLDVYKKSFETALEIHKASLQFPQIEQYAIADQMRRASKSVCANIAEGSGKLESSKLEFKRFLALALGSSNEMLVWIEFCYKLEYIEKTQFEKWYDDYDHICRMLAKLRNT